MIDFKNIFKNKTAVPAVSSDWLNSLSDLDDIDALKTSIKHLSHTLDVVQQESIDAAHLQAHIDLIIALEELNHSRLARLSKQFSSIENLKPELESMMKATCYDYCRLSYICHLKIIDKAIDPTKFKLGGNLPVLIMARAFHMAFNMVKWRMFEHTSPPPNVWLQIYALYGIAQKQMLQTIPVEVFKLSPASTLNAYLVQICMFGQLSHSSLPKHCIEMTSQILTTLLTRVRISNDYVANQFTFFINPNKDVPAARVRDIDVSKQYYYWELDAFEREISTSIRVTEQGEIPTSLSLAKIEPAKKLNETLKALSNEWSKLNHARQRRKENRQSSARTAYINSGFAHICEQIFKTNQKSQGLGSSSLDERLRHHTVIRQASVPTEHDPKTTWLILDESAHGLGARINSSDQTIARTDKLISISFADDPNKVLIGSIRTCKPVASNQLKAGIAILSQRPVWAQLRQSESRQSLSNETQLAPLTSQSSISAHGSIDTGLFSGIYLPLEAGFTEQSVLLLPKSNFQPNAIYEISTQGVSTKIQLGAAIESHEDWVKVLVNFS